MDIRDYIESIIKPQIKQPLWESWYIKDKIGSGSFSVVYRIEARRSEETDVAALKIEAITADDLFITDEARRKASIEQKLQMAVSETRIMKQLRDCSNIVRYEEEYTQEIWLENQFKGYYHLIRMEYLDNVFSLMKDHKFDYSEDNIRKLAIEIGTGLQEAHAIGIIHRDIKPENMFRSSSDIYKLGDFNISKKAASTRSFAGSNYYMAPEVFRSKSNLFESYTTQADIYSFGICLYQMMNDGLLPFEDECLTEEAIEKRLQGQPFPPPKNASSVMIQIIMKACAYETANRYRSMNDLLRDLSAFEKVSSDIIPQLSSGEEYSIKDHRVLLPVIVSGILLASFIGVCVLFNSKAPEYSSEQSLESATEFNETIYANYSTDTTVFSASDTDITTTSTSTTTLPEMVDVYSLYKEYFIKNYSLLDMVCLADVTHDGIDEMIVITGEDSTGDPNRLMFIKGLVYTVEHNEVKQIYEKHGSNGHGTGFFCWYLTENGNLADEIHGMWQGMGEIRFDEYYLAKSGERIEQGSIVLSSEVSETDENGRITNEAYQKYINAVDEKMQSTYLLYSAYTESTVTPLFLETDPRIVFNLINSTNESDPFWGLSQSELEDIARNLFLSQSTTVESCYSYYEGFEIDHSTQLEFEDAPYMPYYLIKNAASTNDVLEILHQTFSEKYDTFNRREIRDEREQGACAIIDCLSEDRGLFKCVDGKMYVLLGDVPPYEYDNLRVSYQSTNENEVWFTITADRVGGRYFTDFSMLLEDGIWKMGACKYPY